MKLNLAIGQMNVFTGQREKNMATVEKLTEGLDSQCDYLVLPELWNIGYDMENIKAKAETSKGESIGFLRKLAKRHHVNIIGGSIAEKHDGEIYNMLPFIDREGNLRRKYRKIHLFPLGLKEDTFFAAGDEWGIFQNEGLTFGVILCYDLRFPAFCRNIALQNSEILFVPAQWPKERIDAFRLLLKARAVENQIFVVGVNRTGSDEIAYNGQSMVVSPNGDVLIDSGEKEGLFCCTVDTAETSAIRQKIPVYSDRRNIFDEIDNNLF